MSCLLKCPGLRVILYATKDIYMFFQGYPKIREVLDYLATSGISQFDMKIEVTFSEIASSNNDALIY